MSLYDRKIDRLLRLAEELETARLEENHKEIVSVIEDLLEFKDQCKYTDLDEIAQSLIDKSAQASIDRAIALINLENKKLIEKGRELQATADKNSAEARAISLEGLNKAADALGSLQDAHNAISKIGDIAGKVKKLKEILEGLKKLKDLRDRVEPFLP